MAISITKANAIIDYIVTGLTRIYVVNDPTNLILVGDNISSHTAKVLDTYRTAVWNSATNGNQVTIDNDLSNNPLYYLIPSGSDITHWVFTNTSGLITAIRTLSAPVSFSVDNAYYIRAFNLVFTEV
jgi:hypothetical protein